MPYTYLLKHIESGKYYYGVRFAKDCKPEDLFVSYFTSSEVIKSIIEEEGTDSFEVQIRKVFHTADDAREWETKFLQRVNAKENPKFLNLNNNKATGAYYGMENGFFGKNHSEETRKIMSEKAKNRKPNRKGAVLSSETKRLVSLNNPNRKTIHTPHGVFVSAEAFAKQTGLITACGLRNMLKVQDEPITKKRMEKSPILIEEDMGKTPRELGWYYE